MVEEFLFCELLKITANAIDVFNLVKDLFLNLGMTLKMCGSIFTDGSLAILGNKSGFPTWMKSDEVTLYTKTLPKNLKICQLLYVH